MKLYYTEINLPTGTAYVAATKDGIVRLELKATSRTGFIDGLRDEFGVAPVEARRPFAALTRELMSYFSGEPVAFTAKVDLRGTEFQRKIWRTLSSIPYGNIRSYKWVAEKAGNPRGARAVGQALNRNPVPIIVPCHRVVQSSGGLGGFGCGLDIKVKLLEVEGVIRTPGAA